MKIEINKKAKLITSPLVGVVPDGLTIGKEYPIIEEFNSNIYDVYIRIIDDNLEQVAWNKSCFEIIKDKCKYCEGDVDDRNYIAKDLELLEDKIYLYIDGNGMLNVSNQDGFYDDTKINYCPMCGRKLVE